MAYYDLSDIARAGHSRDAPQHALRAQRRAHLVRANSSAIPRRSDSRACSGLSRCASAPSSSGLPGIWRVKAEVGDTGSYLRQRAVHRGDDAVDLWRPRRLRLSAALQRMSSSISAASMFAASRNISTAFCSARCPAAPSLLFVDPDHRRPRQRCIQLSSAALGFLAGYNTDFLFSTIERVMAALLPKVGIDSVQRADAAAAPSRPT